MVSDKEKTSFFEKTWENIWRYEKKCLPLHSLFKEHGSVAQLNRASDYGSEGCGFESRRSHRRRNSQKNVSSFFLDYYEGIYRYIYRL